MYISSLHVVMPTYPTLRYLLKYLSADWDGIIQQPLNSFTYKLTTKNESF